MPTVKLDQISVELSRRIGDVVASASTNGKILSAVERTAYINKAMFKLINMYWSESKGDAKSFIELFPELLKTTAALTLASGKYTITTPHADFFYLIDGYDSGNKYIRKLPSTLYHIIKTDNHESYKGTTEKPAVIQLNTTLEFFPAATPSPVVTYIAYPLDNTNGNFLTQGGSVDMPFSFQWLTTITELAEKLFREEAQL